MGVAVYYTGINTREQLFQNNNINESQPNDFNKNTDKSNNTCPPQYTIDPRRQKLNSVQF